MGSIDHPDQLSALLAAERPAFDVDMAKLIRTELKKTKNHCARLRDFGELIG
ncbi:hypothetical protein [Deefgea sp. CFH1-16]|uniref:hypothetical protein n=1 Tax=Deefgea sp. CFH1-16 TaxID=2675457 RepID=UPI0015F3B445|nr:hypothetical protein [Deefgea sp. CFH1-16]MBM5573883.1 hypothetical protein [Deefgea sp. CFH1-16]